jgi:hypothetical protein
MDTSIRKGYFLIVILKFDDEMLEITETWVTSIPKTKVGNTFMICGILYATDSYENIPTFIKYSFNTNNGGSKMFISILCNVVLIKTRYKFLRELMPFFFRVFRGFTRPAVT